jgi:hypothetical protein
MVRTEGGKENREWYNKMICARCWAPDDSIQSEKEAEIVKKKKFKKFGEGNKQNQW